MFDVCENFENFYISNNIKKGLSDTNYFRSTSIQSNVIKLIPQRSNLLLFSPPGSGKTLAYVIDVLQIIYEEYFKDSLDEDIDFPNNKPFCIVFSPTAELCVQIAQEFIKISRHLPLNIYPVIGSIDMEQQWSELKYANIIIGTPGVVTKLVQKKRIKMDKILVMVFDEWDKFFSDKGLMDDVQKVMRNSYPIIQQYIASSATFSTTAFSRLQSAICDQWELVSSDNNLLHKGLVHFCKRIGSFDKRVCFIVFLLRKVKFRQCVIFSNIQNFSKLIQETLTNCGFPCELLVSTSKDREEVINRFMNFQVRCLVSTDVASRGLDMNNVDIVINACVPVDGTTFLHRIGRCGRFGLKGITLTLYKRGERKKLSSYEKEVDVELREFSLSEAKKVMSRVQPLKNEAHILNFNNLLDRQNSLLKNNPMDNSEIDFYSESSEIDQKEEIKINNFIFDERYWEIYRDHCKRYSGIT